MKTYEVRKGVSVLASLHNDQKKHAEEWKRYADH